MKVIGLCGRSGSGKGVVSAVFSELGVPSVDTDAVYHELTAPSADGNGSDCMRELAAEFGEGIRRPDGGLDRRALAAVVFSDRDKLAALNRITHKHILDETDRRLDGFRHDGYGEAIVDAPLLFESGYDKKCDFIIAADAPEDTLLRRIAARDGISIDEAAKRLSSQITSDVLRSRADFVIYTDTDVDTIRRCAERILEDIRGREAKANG